jgi:hypothetical protein
MSKTIKETIAVIIGILTIIGIVFGVNSYIANRYALAEDVRKVEKRLDYKITDDQLQATQERMWKLEDRNKGKQIEKWSESDIERYRLLKEMKEKLKKKLDKMEETK